MPPQHFAPQHTVGVAAPWCPLGFRGAFTVSKETSIDDVTSPVDPRSAVHSLALTTSSYPRQDKTALCANPEGNPHLELHGRRS